MTKLRVLDLFSGIGGFSLGLERTGGFETVAFCEIEPYPRAVLAKHWPGVPCYDDVRTLTADALERDGIAVDVICGGFPCQDLSLAGKQAGMDGTRSGLWSEIARLMGDLRPSYVIVENVSALLSGPAEQRGGWFGRVLGDVAALGYDAEWHCIPAASIGAPHRRDRIWLVAYANGGRGRSDIAGRHDANGQDAQRAQADSLPGTLRHTGGAAGVANATGERCSKTRELRCRKPEKRTGGGSKKMANADAPGLENGRPAGKQAGAYAFEWGMAFSESQRRSGPWWASEPGLDRVADGVPNRVDRIAALGNAVVPQIPELIGRAILKAEGLAA